MLKEKNFALIGNNGIGNPRSKNAQSMAWFMDCLYLGITHHTGEGPEDAARILCFDPENRNWREVYSSPLVQADSKARASHIFGIGKTHRLADRVPKYRGYRGMVVFKGKSDPSPALYVGTLSHWGAQILRSADGESFEPVCQPGLGNDKILSFRALVPFKNKLFAAQAGSVSEEMLDRNFSETTLIHVSDDPAYETSWKPAMTVSFGDESNKAIFGMAVMDSYLYAGTGNAERGFQIWRTDAKDDPPYEWECIISDGAFRYNLNEVAVSMVTFKDALYVGSGLPGLGYDKAHDVGPAAAELIRIYPNKKWDLVVGSPRFTPAGFKVPLSAMGPGFDDPHNSVFWSMAVHRNSLYVGTNNIHTWHGALAGEKEMIGGAHVWATDDGENWEPVTLNGFNNPFAVGIRTLCSTSYGLFIGTSNHQEVERFWLRRTNASAKPSAGGIQVWLGTE